MKIDRLLSFSYLYPVRIFSRVDFPAPEGPIMAVNSPDLNLPLTDLRIVLASAIKE